MLASPFNGALTLGAQRTLIQVGQRLNQSMTRLATGLAINRGADNPAGLISSEALRSQIRSIEAASRNVERANSVVNVAEAGLGEIDDLLGELNGKAVEVANSAGMSDAEREAIQVEVDSIIGSIDRISRSTSFADRRLIDGSLSPLVGDVSSNVESIDVHSANLGPGESVDVSVAVTQAAEQAGLVLSLGGANLNLGGAGASDGAGELFKIEVSGAQGSVEFAFASGTSLDDIASSINQQTGSTGVEARVSGTAVVLNSSNYGSDEFVSVEVVDDGGIDAPFTSGVYQFTEGDPSSVDPGSFTDFASASNGVTDEGVDVQGTINGIEATGDGTSLSIDTSFLSVSVDLKVGSGGGGASATNAGVMTAATVVGQSSFLIGPEVSSTFRVGIGFMNAGASRLGKFSQNGERFSLADLKSGGSLNLVDGDVSGAQRAIRGAMSQVSSERGRLGGFQGNLLGALRDDLGVSLENVTAAESIIRDTDFAFEVAALARGGILQQAGIGMFNIAKAAPSFALNLLR